MAPSPALLGLRGNRRATGESYHALAAVTVVIVCSGLVLSATHWATDNARREAARQRALAQGEVFLDALSADPEIRGPGLSLSWEGAMRVAAGLAELAFLPPSVKVFALREAARGGELLVLGDTAQLGPATVIIERAVLLERSDGTFGAGIARAGVDLS